MYTNNRDNYICFIALLAFMIMPLLGIIIMLSVNLSSPKIDKFRYLFFFCLLACYLGAINSTKVPVSDQWNYWLAYKEVPKMGFIGSLHNAYGSYYNHVHLTAATKDMGFGLLNYIGYYLTFGYYPLFILLFSVILYYCLFYAIFEYFTYISNERKAKQRILSGVVLIAFFTQFFNLTIHLQRQEIATTIIILAMVLYVIRGQRNWLLIIIALSLHTSVTMFLPVFFIANIIERRSKKWLIYFIMCVALVLFTLASTAQYLLNSFGIDSAYLNRIANMGEETEEERMSIGLVLFLGLPMLYVSIRKLFFQQQERRKRERIIFLIYIIIMIFVLTTPDNVMQYRFFMLTYIFIPLIYPLLLEDTRYDKIWLSIIPVIMTLRFFFTFEDIVYEYAPIENVLLCNPISLLLYRM